MGRAVTICLLRLPLRPQLLWWCLIGLLFIGCLEDRKSAAPVDKSASVPWGIYNVINLGGSPLAIKVQWKPKTNATAYNIYAVVKDPVTNQVDWTLINVYTPRVGSPNGELKACRDPLTQQLGDTACHEFIHRDAAALTPGNVYTYRVRAVSADGSEDQNMIHMSVVGFEGVSGVTITGTSTAIIRINPVGSFNYVRVTATPSRCTANPAYCAQGQNVLNKIARKATEIPIGNLQSGTKYLFNVQVYTSDTNGPTDGNSYNLQAQTKSFSFGTGAPDEDSGAYGFRNVRLVQAYGDAPHEINKITLATAPADMWADDYPERRIIKILPNPFSGVPSGAKVRVIRKSGEGLTGYSAPSVFDTTTTIPCQRDTTESCVVCSQYLEQDNPAIPTVGRNSTLTISTTAPQPLNGDCDQDILNSKGEPSMFYDRNIMDPHKNPKKLTKKYYYTIVQSLNQWPEELPTQNPGDFMFAAHVPDQYMVLVQRESVNYEMCSLMNRSTDPRKANHCQYAGLAATPYTSSGARLPLPEGFYDFGYNLMVDRHQLACNWSRADASSTCEGGNGCFQLDMFKYDFNDNQDKFAREFYNDVESFARLNKEKVSTDPMTGNTVYSYEPRLNPKLYNVMFNMQFKGANCYLAANYDRDMVRGPSSLVLWHPISKLASVTNDPQLAEQVKIATTTDPGPLRDAYSDRKRPVIASVTNIQAQQLCNLHTTSSGAPKRLLRRREYIASSGLASFPGEPLYLPNPSQRWNIKRGSAGQTLYDWSKNTGESYSSSGGTDPNPGGCAQGPNTAATISNALNVGYRCTESGTNPDLKRPYNIKVSAFSSAYCANNPTCDYNHASTPGNFNTANECHESTNPVNESSVFSQLTADFLSKKNETSQLYDYRHHYKNSYSHPFFIGSLATNKCVSRFGIQDPYATSSYTIGGRFWSEFNTSLGILLMDSFAQDITDDTNDGAKGLKFTPISNTLDLGVIHDYEYNGANIATFGSSGSHYSFVGTNRSQSRLCCSEISPGQFDCATYFTNNYFYLNLSPLASKLGECASTPTSPVDDGGLGRINTPRQSYSSLPGFMPVLGIPVTQAAMGPNAVYPSLSSFLGKELNSPSSADYTYVRAFVADPNPISGTSKMINMSTGAGSRWSYELSETPEINSGASVLCAVEAEK